jgi:prevent-host-death family protein
MSKIGASEARNRLSSLLDRVENGEEVVITRRGKEVARLLPAAGTFDRTRADTAARGLMEVSRGLSLGGLAVKQLVDQGRQ